jgi:Holliday junction resolvasome RuvABC endonuclease subunit
MRILGIDPGKTGALACLNRVVGTWSVTTLQDLPLSSDKSLSWIDGERLEQLLRVTGPNVAVVERVSAMPNQGVSSCFHFGMVFGSILSILQAAHIPTVLVTPVVWKKALGLPGGKQKAPALHKARLLYPDAQASLALQKHHNRAEALLLAHWYRITHWQPGAKTPGTSSETSM